MSDNARPLQEPTFLILTALTPSARHGYAVLKEVEQLSDGRVVLRPGTLYAALDRLTVDGLVEVDREEVTDGRLRRYYRITDAGGARLADEAQRMRSNASVALKRLRLGAAGA